MAAPPNNYHKARTTSVVVYESPTHGVLTIYCTNRIVYASHTDCHSSTINFVWDKELNRDNIEGIAQQCSDDVQTMKHWMEEEIMKFVAEFIPID